MKLKQVRFDYSLLKLAIRGRYSTMEEFANRLGVSRTTLSLKLNGKVQFTTKDIDMCCNLLEIPPMDIGKYFFSVKESEE